MLPEEAVKVPLFANGIPVPESVRVLAPVASVLPILTVHTVPTVVFPARVFTPAVDVCKFA